MYAKIFTQIFDSSIADNWKHRHVFEDLLKLADKNGVVDMTPEAICSRTRMPAKMINDALIDLSKPDLRSRSKEEEGRRLVLVDPSRSWGWRIVNYRKYREMRCEFDRKAYMAEYMRDRRLLNSVKLEVNAVKLSPYAYASSSAPSGEGTGRGGLDLINWFKTQLSELFNRRNTCIWSQREESKIAEICLRPDFQTEWSSLKNYRGKNRQYFARSIGRLLEDWNDYLDRSRSESTKTPYSPNI